MTLTPRLVELVALFNAQKTDLPPDAIHKDCVFRLNGRAYHDTLGRPIDDPLIRLIGCGPAAYRLLLTAIRYAINGPRVTLGGDDPHGGSPAGVVCTRATLSGRLRGSDVPIRAECEVALRADEASGPIREIAVTMGDADVELILAARSR